MVPDSYWEEKWRVMQKSQEREQGSKGKEVAEKKKGWSHRMRLSFSRTESDPSPAKVEGEISTSVQRNLIDDLSRAQKCNGVAEETNFQRISVEKKGLNEHFAEVECVEENSHKDSISTPQEGFRGRKSEESWPLFSRSAIQTSLVADLGNDTDRSSVASNRSADEQYHLQPSGVTMPPLIDEDAPVNFCPGYDSTEKANAPHTYNGDAPSKCHLTSDYTGKTVAGLKERKLLSGKFQWLRKLRQNSPIETTSEKCEVESKKDNSTRYFVGNNSASPSVTSKGDGCNDQSVVGTLNYLGQSMLAHVQVIESIFQQDRVQSGSPESFSTSISVDKGQVTAMEALKELRRISNLLSEM
ncbi:hypothetical protein SAY86_022770 [Trapa natans]|uniref:Uncharacterized protein n=1 Tax=Trapa natans TaxID=22666 RepID=A0AAN7R8P5_TRANT|nr:hypothetical protein SAY86_022770 [Trapa natans]